MRFSRHFLALLLCSSLPLVARGDEKPAAPETPAAAGAPELKTLEQRASYALGKNLASQIVFDERFSFADRQILIRGFEDALKEQKSLLTDEEIAETMLELRAKIEKDEVTRQKKIAEGNAKAGAEFLAKNKERKEVKTLESGLQYEVLKSGKEERKPGIKDVITAHYHGTLIDGTVFDSSVQREEPVQFPVNGVIAGWTEALQLMNVGDKWKLYIPADLAYGERGAGRSIGPNAALVFEVELISIDTPDKE